MEPGREQDAKLVMAALKRGSRVQLIAGAATAVGLVLGPGLLIWGEGVQRGVGAFFLLSGALGVFMVVHALRSRARLRMLGAELMAGRGLLWVYKEDTVGAGGGTLQEIVHLFDVEGREHLGPCYSGQGSTVIEAAARLCPGARFGFDPDLRKLYQQARPEFLKAIGAS